MRKLEKSERRGSERNSFLACSFSAAREVHSGEANAYFLTGNIPPFIKHGIWVTAWMLGLTQNVLYRFNPCFRKTITFGIVRCW